MSASPARRRPPAWSNQQIALYHGTIDRFARILAEERVRVDISTAPSDFGPGFYTTTNPGQASSWAMSRSRQVAQSKPVVVEFRIDRDLLATLEALSFVRGDFAAEDYWSFVSHCRQGSDHHARSSPGTKRFDVVFGPLALRWRDRLIARDWDQVSFHTSRAESVLNASHRRIL